MSSDEPYLRVYYPYGGRRFLLHWWTYDERGNLIVAESERSLLAAAKSVFDREPCAEIKAVRLVEVVAPSQSLHVLARTVDRAEAARTFFHVVLSCVRDAVKDGHELPPLFRLCPTYEPQDDEGAQDLAQDNWMREVHYDCKHCRDRLQCDLTPGDFYATYHARWEEAFRSEHPDWPAPAPKGPQQVPSRAAPARDGEPLGYATSAGFGHHGSGLTLETVDLPEARRLGGFGDSVLFFFRPIADLDQAPYQAILDEANAAWKREQAAREAKREEDFERERRERHEKALGVFRSKP